MKTSKPTKAHQHIRPLRGGSQARLMAADDGHNYVVKFQGNPQATRVLANEYMAARLARIVGLNVPEPAILEVDVSTIHRCEISFQLGEALVVPRAGLHFGSRLILDDELHDWLPNTCLNNIANLSEFAGVLAFDKWTGNADGRQVVFHRHHSQREYTAAFIDFGYCFNAAEWSFPDMPFRGVYGRQEVYSHVKCWDDFQPWLSRIERCSPTAIQTIAEEIPTEWYGERNDLNRLVQQLLERRDVVRRLITQFRDSYRNPFPSWE